MEIILESAFWDDRATLIDTSVLFFLSSVLYVYNRFLTDKNYYIRLWAFGNHG